MPERTKQCPVAGCGNEFPCANGDRAGRCWCDRVTVGTERLVELRSMYDDCLCPRHLQVQETQETDAPS